MGFLCGFIFGIIFILIIQSQLRRTEFLEQKRKMKEQQQKYFVTVEKFGLKDYEHKKR